MAKVTITIDDANPAIVAAFGADALTTSANDLGYMEMVEKSPEELPEKVETQIEMDGETITKLDYPEGTEFYKPNPHTRADFVAQKMLRDQIIPVLVRNLRTRKEAEARATVDAELKQAQDIIEQAAEVITE